MTDSRSSTLHTFESLFQRAQTLENEGRLDEALATYDQAVALLRVAGDSNDPATLHALGLAWMSRGNTLQRVGTAPSLADAIRAYDVAISSFRALPTDREPVFRNHLGAAWLNRGHAQILAGQDAEAAESFTAAASELESLPLEQDPHFRLNLAGAHTNLAHALLSGREHGLLTTDDVPSRAATAARAALQVLAEVERSHEAFAGLSLRARRALVVALGPQLSAPEVQGQPLNAIASEATDAIDEGLALARDLEAAGLSHHRPVAHRLFRLGAQIYGTRQPHFLGEFVLETLATPAFAADAEFRAVATAALDQALALVQRAAISPDATRALETAESLRAARQQLDALPALPSAPATS